ncbi:MAG: 2-keto-4-pentenoate hydratase [Oceanicoccus sp.]|jgi:2-keto-4-pentenoate hydratase
MQDGIIARAAQRLRDAQTSGQPCEPIRSLFEEKDLTSAYAVKAYNQKIWQQHRQRVGCKIGITSVAVQNFLGMTEPDYGFLYRDMYIQSGGNLSRGSVYMPKLEVEIGLVLGKNIDILAPTKADIIDAIEYATPVFEVVDSRILNWDVHAVDTIADNGSSGLFVSGEARAPLDSFDFKACQMSLLCNGEIIAKGNAIENLGDPIEHAVWLGAKLAAIGSPLMAGDILLTGALAPMIDMNEGDNYQANIEGLGSVVLSVVA